MINTQKNKTHSHEDVQSPIKERMYKVTTIVFAHSLQDALGKYHKNTPVSIELMDETLNKGIIGFHVNTSGEQMV